MRAGWTPWRTVYRSILRETRYLPDEAAATYHRKLARELIQRYDEIPHRSVRLLRTLQAANAGYLQALDLVIGRTYGVRGKQAKASIEAVLADARIGRKAPLIPGEDRTRLPSYTPRLTAFLTSKYQKRTAKLPNLFKPPSLPDRADPQSEDARLLGPFSLRRHANIYWRYLTSLRDGLRPVLTQDNADKLSNLIHNTPSVQPYITERATLKAAERVDTKHLGKRPKKITRRFLRRRYTEALKEGVEMHLHTNRNGLQVWKVTKSIKTRVTMARGSTASAEDVAWITEKYARRQIQAKETRTERQQRLARYVILAYKIATNVT